MPTQNDLHGFPAFSMAFARASALVRREDPAHLVNLMHDDHLSDFLELPDRRDLFPLDLADRRTVGKQSEAGDSADTSAALVRLRFTPQAGYELLKSYHWVREDPLILEDASVEVEFRLRDESQVQELLPWILAWVDQVEVLSPSSLRHSWRLALRGQEKLQGANRLVHP